MRFTRRVTWHRSASRAIEILSTTPPSVSSSSSSSSSSRVAKFLSGVYERTFDLSKNVTHPTTKKKKRKRKTLNFFCVSKCTYLHIRHAHDDGEYYSSKSDERTRRQKGRRRLRGGPLFFLPAFASERERERILFARIFLCQKKHKIIGRTHHKNPIIHSYFRTHLFCASSFRKHKNNARTPPPIIIIIIIIREGGGVLKNETAGPNCHVTTTTTRASFPLDLL